MSHAVRMFVPAVLAASLIGTSSTGVADEPVATARIPPPPLAAEPVSPATPMVIPTTPPVKPEATATASKKTPETAAAASQNKPENAAHERRSKRHVSRQAVAGKRARRKPAAEKTVKTTTAEGAAVASAADAAEKDAARQKAPDAGRKRYQDARRARRQTSPEPPVPALSPPLHDSGAYGNGSYDGTGPYPSPPTASGPPPRYYAEYPRQPMFNGPAYPPPWYNGPPPGYYPAPWRGGPMPRW